ncbi:MAG: hypothetical protein JSW16_07130 [Dehalococcoidales bacterium]|nr:MAG: hypothetical protein JSW16_07130 [Dehalococcoidales bacterium]
MFVSVTGCTILEPYIYLKDSGTIQIGGDGEPIELIDNPDATNPTYAELVAFISKDGTDTNEYIPGKYVCADFAEDVHNNAEAAGIRAAWVGIEFEGDDIGHALNAFETTDKGLVYIDCTGSTREKELDKIETNGGGDISLTEPIPRDTAAYVEIGREYGTIYITKATSLSYDFYLEYKQTWQEYTILLNDYNEQVIAYNQETEGKVYYTGSLELAEIQLWEAKIVRMRDELEELGEQLGDFWFESLGIIEDIHIYWGRNG